VQGARLSARQNIGKLSETDRDFPSRKTQRKTRPRIAAVSIAGESIMSKILRGLPGKRLLVGASTLALACASAFAWYETTSHAAEAVVSTEPEARLVKTVRVEPKPIADDRSAVGEIRPRRESDLGFRVSARLIERMVDVGASVTKGQLLARVEDQDYRNRLRSAKAD
jgi:multidrug efflux pump subunit AcrA (membrane-fusion protein)